MQHGSRKFAGFGLLVVVAAQGNEVVFVQPQVPCFFQRLDVMDREAAIRQPAGCKAHPAEISISGADTVPLALPLLRAAECVLLFCAFAQWPLPAVDPAIVNTPTVRTSTQHSGSPPI